MRDRESEMVSTEFLFTHYLQLWDLGERHSQRWSAQNSSSHSTYNCETWVRDRVRDGHHRIPLHTLLTTVRPGWETESEMVTTEFLFTHYLQLWDLGERQRVRDGQHRIPLHTLLTTVRPRWETESQRWSAQNSSSHTTYNCETWVRDTESEMVTTEFLFTLYLQPWDLGERHRVRDGQHRIPLHKLLTTVRPRWETESQRWSTQNLPHTLLLTVGKTWVRERESKTVNTTFFFISCFRHQVRPRWEVKTERWPT